MEKIARQLKNHSINILRPPWMHGGASILLGTGYEFFHSGKLSMDIQGRVHYGYANVPEGMRTGLACNLLLGVNWHK